MEGTLQGAPVVSPSNRASGGLSAFFQPKASLLTPSEGWVTVGLLLAMDLVVVFTVQNSHWVSPMPPLPLVAVLALLVSLGAAKYRGPLLLQVLAHLSVLALGAGVCLTEAASTLTGSTSDKFQELFARLDSWGSALSTRGISNDRLPFVLILVAATWVIMYLSTVFTFRLRWTWAAVIPAALGLMTNQTYLPTRTYPVPLLFFLLFAILLMGRTYFLGRTSEWQGQSLEARAPRMAILANVLVITFLVLTVAWAIPTGKIVIGPLQDTYQTARGPWVDLEDNFERVFAGIPSQKATPLHNFGDALPLRGRVSLGATEVLTVTADYPAYWRAQTYDYYEGRGWVARPDQRQTLKAARLPAPAEGAAYQKRETIAQKVTLKKDSEVLFAGGQPVEVSIPTQVEVATAPTYEISLRQEPASGALPTDLRAAASRIVAAGATGGEAQRLLPQGTKVVREGRDSIVVTREEPRIPDILAIRGAKRLKADSSYEVLSSVSTATEQDLRSDRSFYPRWVRDNYLQVPATLPSRVKDLARSLTKDARTPYDKSVAIEGYLRTFQETFDIEPPPLNVDAVDHFLFSMKAGYGDYFASAMTVLLRAADVPARLATGYATGAFDKQSSTFTVRLADAHSWPEVYFPTYGWVSFEPTPSKALIPRGPLGEAAIEGASAGGAGTDEFLEDLFLQNDPFLNDTLTPLQQESGSGTFVEIGRDVALAVGSLVGLLAMIALLFTALWQVNFVGLPYAAGVYSRMARLGTLTFRAPSPMETPAEYASGLAGAVSLRPEDAGAIAHGFMKSRYGSRILSEEDRAQVERSWRAVRSALVRRLVHRVNLLELLKREG